MLKEVKQQAVDQQYQKAAQEYRHKFALPLGQADVALPAITHVPLDPVPGIYSGHACRFSRWSPARQGGLRQSTNTR